MVDFYVKMFMYPASWIAEIFTRSGMFGFFLAMFFTYRLIFLIMSPVLSQSGSDKSKRSRWKEK